MENQAQVLQCKVRTEYLFRDIVFFIGLVLALLCVTLPFLRYLFFFIPFLVVLAMLADGKARLGDEVKPFFAFIVAGVVLIPLANAEGVKDLFLTFAGISIALLARVPRLKLWTLFQLLFAGAVIYFAIGGKFSGDVAFDIAKSESPFESTFGFLFGVLAPFALINKQYRLFFLSLLMSMLCLKRIAVLGALVAAVFILLGEKRGKWILNPVVMIPINIALVGLLLGYGYGTFDYWIYEITGQSANQFGMGRQELLALPAREIFSHPELFIIGGMGPGSSYDLARLSFASLGKVNLHSDLVKLVYEYGFVFFMIFIGLMYSAKKYFTRVGFIFLNVLFLTDNTLIYYFMLFIFIYCARMATDAAEQTNTITSPLKG